ncbi:hypothetical protein GGI07_002908 [Coemansia sp. Benny D115]|nr:hypothetical protein GGI07_002908 [Coemansia sp. Benny D115]
MPVDTLQMFERSLAVCEKQTTHMSFKEPLDMEQVRRLTNIQNIIADYHRNIETLGEGPGGFSTYRGRILQLADLIRPWVAKKELLLESLDRKEEDAVEEATEEDVVDSSASSPFSSDKNVVEIQADSNNAPEKADNNDDVLAKQDEKENSSESLLGVDAQDSMPLVEKPPMSAVERLNAAPPVREMHVRRSKLLGDVDGLRRRGVIPESAEGVEKLLRSQRETHAGLSGDLVSMAEILKRNTAALSDLVEKDKAVVDETAEVLDQNLVNMDTHGTRLNKYRKRAWGTTGMTWLMVLVVISVFFVMVLFMRVAPKRY